MRILLALLIAIPQDDAERKKKEEAVRKRLGEIFEIAKGDDFSKGAACLVYRGKDEKRKWKDIYDYKVEDEKKTVDETFKAIKVLLKEHESHELGEFSVEKESEGEWYVIEVTFKKGEKTKKVAFCFLKVKEAYAIGDID